MQRLVKSHVIQIDATLTRVEERYRLPDSTYFFFYASVTPIWKCAKLWFFFSTSDTVIPFYSTIYTNFNSLHFFFSSKIYMYSSWMLSFICICIETTNRVTEKEKHSSTALYRSFPLFAFSVVILVNKSNSHSVYIKLLFVC